MPVVKHIKSVQLTRRLLLAWATILPLIVLGYGMGMGPGATPVIAPDAILTTPIDGLKNTEAARQIVPVSEPEFSHALRVSIGRPAAETNATQLTVLTTTPIEKGDVLLASFYVRGGSVTEKSPARIEFLFEKVTDPWTRSVGLNVITLKNNSAWKQVFVPFTSMDSYGPGEAQAAFRFAFGVQNVEVGGLEVVNYGKTKSIDDVLAFVASKEPLGKANVDIQLTQSKQTLRGFGGNFAEPRYGFNEPMDAVGNYNLERLRVVHARIGIPLNEWNPGPGVYKDEGPARASFLQMQMMAQRNIPITGSIWEGPLWLLGGSPEEPGRTLPSERYADTIEVIADYLFTARDKYGVTVNYISFNEPDEGVNFKFTPEQMAAFIRVAGPRFAALGLETKFLVGDTASGSNFVEYARPLLEDNSIAPYLGPLAFHSWDALDMAESTYMDIAELGRQYNKPIWCTEGGHNATLWHQTDPWHTWENALRTAQAYERTLQFTGAEQIDYWTYQDNYPLVSEDGTKPFPVWHVIRQMEEALPPGSKVAEATSSQEDLKVLAALGPKPGQFAVLLVNPIGSGEVTLQGLPPGALVSIVESVAEVQHRIVAERLEVDKSGRITVPLPIRSVITIVSGGSSEVR